MQKVRSIREGKFSKMPMNWAADLLWSIPSSSSFVRVLDVNHRKSRSPSESLDQDSSVKSGACLSTASSSESPNDMVRHFNRGR